MTARVRVSPVSWAMACASRCASGSLTLRLVALSFCTILLPFLILSGFQEVVCICRILSEVTSQILDLLLLFPYAGRHACSSFPQVLRGLLQEMRPRRLSRNRPLPCQLDLRGVFAVWREAEVP